MVIQTFENPSERVELVGMSIVLVIIGIPLIALAPAKPARKLAPAVNV